MAIVCGGMALASAANSTGVGLPQTPAASSVKKRTIARYPITKEMHNPLFTEFPSVMWESDSVGRLFTADPSGHVWTDGRLYVYASHDMEPPWGCDRMDRYHVFSTDDLVSWTDHGEILSSDDVKYQSGWGIPGWMWAPDCAYNPDNGKYYFYFPHVNQPLPQGGHEWRVGIAVSDSPASDFHTLGYVEGAPSLIDPAVFVDDDGQPYIYNGGGGQCAGGKLRRDDWTRLDGEMKPMEGLVDFHEGTWVHKYNGKYYLTHSDNHGGDGNRMRYAMADTPLGPWTDMGVYLYPTGCGTSHGSVVNFNGKWYQLYHCSNPSGRDELRSVCIDQLEYNPDGTIKPIHNWGTPHGEMLILPNSGETLIINATGYNDGGRNYAFWKNGAETPENGDGKEGAYIKNVGKGDWMRYSINAGNSGSEGDTDNGGNGSRSDNGGVSDEAKYEITFRVAPKADGTSFHLSANGDNLTGSISLDGNTDRFSDITVENVTIPRDIEYLDLRAENGAFDIKEIRIARL